MFKDETVVFTKDALFGYNLKKKRLSSILTITLLLLLAILICYYVIFLKNSDKLFVLIINSFFAHILVHVKGATFLGVFYASLFGGLFFVIMPLEAVFVAFLRAGHSPFILIPIYVSGLVISYTVNYLIGMKLTEISKKLITPKKFYKIKKVINRFGAPAVFVFNVLPLPSQPLAAILGVFKYNKTKFYFFFVIGQVIKYTLITMGYIYIFR